MEGTADDAEIDVGGNRLGRKNGGLTKKKG